MGVLVFKLNGVDVSITVEKNSVNIQNALTRRSDMALLKIVDDHTATQPEAGQKLEVLDGATPIFGGIIATVTRDLIRGDIDVFSIRTQDFTKILQKRHVVRVFNVPTLAGDIIKTVITDFVKDPSITVVNVQDGPLIDFISFNYKRADQVFNELARITGFEWYIDELKDVHFFEPSTTPAPFTIDATDTRYKDFFIKASSTQLRNRVTVRGGDTLSDFFTQTLLGDGTALEFGTAYRPLELTAEVDTGSGFGAVTMGVDNVDDAGDFDFMLNTEEKLVRNGSHAILTAAHKIRLTYKFPVPVIVQIEDAASIATIAALEDSDGVYDFVLVNEDITDLETARERGKAEITKFGAIQFTGGFKTHESGFRAGQELTINFPSRGLPNKKVLVQKVNLKSLGSGIAEYKISFGTFSFALEDFLIDLFNVGRRIAIREGEVVDDFILVGETVTIIDSAPVFVESGPPFVWGPDAGNTTTWNFGQWA